MKTIQDFIQNYIDWNHSLKTNPDFLDMLGISSETEVKTCVFEFYDGDTFNLVKIDVDDLLGFGTACGTVGNTCFDNDVINFLKEKGVPYIITTIVTSEPNTIGSCWIPIKSGGSKLEKLLDARNGSLRYDGYKLKGHSFFETE